jgi:hypothetical protein
VTTASAKRIKAKDRRRISDGGITHAHGGQERKEGSQQRRGDRFDSTAADASIEG